jgi:hypothetical protein
MPAGSWFPSARCRWTSRDFETLAGHRPLMRLYLQQDRLGDPFRLAADVDHYGEGLRKAGFE